MSSSSSPPLKLLGAASFRTFRCLWMLEELGRDYEHIAVQPRSKKLAPHNPLGKVPVLLDGDGFCLYESAAINTYLGEETTFVPSDKKQRAIYHQLTLTIMTEIDAQGLWIHRKHSMLGQYFGDIPDAVKEARRCFEAAQEKVMIPHLERSKDQQRQQQHNANDYYLLGGNFTSVDILYVHCLDWAKSIGWISSSGTSNTAGATVPVTLQEYWDRCRARPAFQRAASIRRSETQQQKESRSNL